MHDYDWTALPTLLGVVGYGGLTYGFIFCLFAFLASLSAVLVWLYARARSAPRR